MVYRQRDSRTFETVSALYLCWHTDWGCCRRVKQEMDNIKGHMKLHYNLYRPLGNKHDDDFRQVTSWIRDIFVPSSTMMIKLSLPQMKVKSLSPVERLAGRRGTSTTELCLESRESTDLNRILPSINGTILSCILRRIDITQVTGNHRHTRIRIFFNMVRGGG